AQHGLALAVGSQAFETPSLVGDLALRVEDLEEPFVALRGGVRALLRFVDDLPCVLRGHTRERQPQHERALRHAQRERLIHTRAPPRANRARPIPPARSPPRTPPPAS